MPSRPRNRIRRQGGAAAAAKGVVAAGDFSVTVGGSDENLEPSTQSQEQRRGYDDGDKEGTNGAVLGACVVARSTPKATTSASSPLDDDETTTLTPLSSSSLSLLPPPPQPQLTPLVDMASSAAQLDRRVARALSLDVAELSGEELRGELLSLFVLSFSFFPPSAPRPKKTSTLTFFFFFSPGKKNSPTRTQLPRSPSSTASPWQ